MAGIAVATCIYEESRHFIENCLRNGAKLNESDEVNSNVDVSNV